MRKIFFVIPLIFLLLSSCHSTEKILKSKDVSYQLTKANEYYDAGKWFKANEVYQALIPVFRGTKNYEELVYRYCYTFYNMKEYLSASYQFKNFISAFPNSKRADECEFMYATSMYKQSPRFPMDQTVTEKAIAVLQSYIDGHPNSPNLIKANSYIDICKEKLEKKASARAELYFDMQDYKAATVAYQSVIQAYPASKSGDFYLFMRQRSFFQYASASVLSKQLERFQESLDMFDQLKEYYPNSEYMSDALALKSEAQNKINKSKKNK